MSYNYFSHPVGVIRTSDKTSYEIFQQETQRWKCLSPEKFFCSFESECTEISADVAFESTRRTAEKALRVASPAALTLYKPPLNAIAPYRVPPTKVARHGPLLEVLRIISLMKRLPR